MTLTSKLEARFRHELAKARLVLDAAGPFYRASTLTRLHAGLPPSPALFRTAGGGWWAAGSEGPVERAATCGETLDKLEELAPAVAEDEARIMTLAGELLVSDADTRAALLDHAAEVWPWTSVHAFGDFPAILPNTVSNLVELLGEDYSPRARRWASVNHADVIAWAAEGLERREAGQGKLYRARCDGSELVAFHEHGPDGKSIGLPVVQPRRIAWPTGGGFPEHLVLGTANGGAGDLVSGEQLEVLYQALPPAVLHARALFRDVERIAGGDEQRRLLERVAPLALAEAKAEASDDARGTFAEALRRNVAKLRLRLRLDGPPPATEAEALALLDTINESFAGYLETRGEAGARVARDVRAAAAKHASSDAGERWANWRAEPDAEPPWLVALAVVVWLHEAKREITQRPALVMPVHVDVTRMHSRAFVLETREGQRALTFDDTAPIMLTSIADTALAKLVERGAKLLGSVNAHKLLRWELVTGHTQALRGDADPRMLVVDGGWSTLAGDVLRIKGKRAAEEIRAIIHAQQAVTFPLPTGGTAHGLLTFHDTPARGRRRGHIEITLGSMLLPHFVHEIGGHGRDASEARRLVPVLRELPPMVGRDNEHGALATLSMLVVRELRTHARELAEVGSVEITPERFEALAREARLPLPTLRLALPRWLRDGGPPRDSDDAPAFLASPSPDRFTLGPAHAPELAFLVAAGRDVLVSSNAGLKSVETRSRKRRRLGRRE